ncbi:MAG: hypothetical protein ABSC06_35045 [Rhodopila sp.]|jgi:hypothetical protein
MNRTKHATRNAMIRQRRAEGALIKNIVADFGVSKARVSVICAGVATPRLEARAFSSMQAAREVRTIRTIELDDVTRAEIEAARREQAPPYKAAAGWPA